jgi:hypothetical protein
MNNGRSEKARIAKRVEVSIDATLLRADGLVQDVKLRDLSFYGCKAVAATTLACGEYIKIDLPNIGMVRARVSWASASVFGATFPIAVDVRKCVAPSATLEPCLATRCS